MDLPENPNVVTVVQLVRTLDCDSRGRGFKSPRSPQFPTNLTLWKQARELNERASAYSKAHGETRLKLVSDDYHFLEACSRKLRIADIVEDE